MRPDTIEQRLTRAALALAGALKKANIRVVFAESCTAGFGLSKSWLAFQGSQLTIVVRRVTYRNDTKARWLRVSPQTLETVGAVSRETALQMATGVLANTPEADIAVSITGHLGPNAPEQLDGVVWIGLANRRGDTNAVHNSLAELAPEDSSRAFRQSLAACLAMEAALSLTSV